MTNSGKDNVTLKILKKLRKWESNTDRIWARWPKYGSGWNNKKHKSNWDNDRNSEGFPIHSWGDAATDCIPLSMVLN